MQSYSAGLKAEAEVNVDIAQARRWFLELEEHPERYRFDTHEGFAITQGRFGVVGARFETRERFHVLRLRLAFELTAVEENRFCFRVARPKLPIWGAFSVEETAEGTTFLCLDIGGTTRLGNQLLRLPVVHGAIQQQIRAEVKHIKASMEATYSVAGTEALGQG